MLNKKNYLLTFFIVFYLLLSPFKDTIKSIETTITPEGIAYIFYDWPKVPESFRIEKNALNIPPTKPIVILLWIGNRIALVDTEPVTLDTSPLIYKGRTMVPVRFIAEAFGADVFFDAAEQEIDIAFGTVYISLWVNKTRARIEVTENGQRNNRIVTLDAPPIIRNGRTLVPVRFIAEAFGATIDWDGKEEKITITLLVGSQGGSPPPPPEEEEVNERGNSVGNIVNGGIVAQQGEWIYYRNPSDGNTLYKIRTDGTERMKLNDDSSGYINVVGEWIYYQNNSDSGKLYRIKNNGSGRQKLNENDSYYLNLIGEWIYYMNWDDQGKLYKIRTDGTGRVKLNEDWSSYVNAVGDWVYYSNRSDKWNLYKIRTDGTGRIKVDEDECGYLNVVGEWIYFVNWSNYGNIYKIRIDGSEKIKLHTVNASYLNVVNDYIFFQNQKMNNGIYEQTLHKIHINGTEQTKLNDDQSINLNILGDWIFYIINDQSGKLYKIHKNGNERQEMDSIAPSSSPKESTNVTRGNSVGNIVNGGSVAKDENWIFFSNHNDEGKLYKMNIDGTKYFKLNDENASNINIVGEWIFYSNYSDWGSIYKIHKDGTMKIKVNDQPQSNYMNIVNKCVYFVNDGGSAGRIFKIHSLEEISKYSDEIELSDKEFCNHLNVCNNKMFFSCNEDDGKIYKTNIDGSNLQRINNDNSSFLNVVDEWVYYINKSDNDYIYKIRVDGTGRTKLVNDMSWHINVEEGWIYYNNKSDKYKLYKIRTDGTGRTKLNNDECSWINIASDWIFYFNSLDNQHYKIRTDGTGRSKVGGSSLNKGLVLATSLKFFHKNHIGNIYYSYLVAI